MAIMMNGGLYLKREPDYVELTLEEIEKFTMLRNWLIESISRSNPDSEDIVNELRADTEETIEKGAPVLDSYKHIWVSLVDKDGIRMIEKDGNKDAEPKTYNTLKEMEKDFISLIDVLETAEYKGEEYIMLTEIEEPTIVTLGEDNSLISKVLKNASSIRVLLDGAEKEPGSIVTYVYGNRAIIFDPQTEKYEVVVASEFLPKTAGVKKEKHYEFNNPSELYYAILKQVHSKKKKL